MIEFALFFSNNDRWQVLRIEYFHLISQLKNNQVIVIHVIVNRNMWLYQYSNYKNLSEKLSSKSQIIIKTMTYIVRD